MIFLYKVEILNFKVEKTRIDLKFELEWTYFDFGI